MVHEKKGKNYLSTLTALKRRKMEEEIQVTLEEAIQNLKKTMNTKNQNPRGVKRKSESVL